MEGAKNKEKKQSEKTDEKDKGKEKGQQPKDKEKKEEQELVGGGLRAGWRYGRQLFYLSHGRFDNMVEQAEVRAVQESDCLKFP